MKKTVFISLIIMSFLIGGLNEQTFEEYFHKEMERRGKEYHGERDFSYSLVHHEQHVIHKNDAIAIYTTNSDLGELIMLAYFKKEYGTWVWKETTGDEWGPPTNWTTTHQGMPYFFTGAILDRTISKIYVGQNPAKFIKLEGDKRFWYAISDNKEAEVKAIKKDGTKEVIEKTDYEYLIKTYMK